MGVRLLPIDFICAFDLTRCDQQGERIDFPAQCCEHCIFWLSGTGLQILIPFILFSYPASSPRAESF